MEFTINEDGSVTRKTSSDSNYNRNGGNNGENGDKNGCLWGIIAIIAGVIIAIATSNKSTSNSNHEVIDTTDNSYNNSYLSVSPSSVSFDSYGGCKTLSVNSSDLWRITTNTYEWGHLSISGNKITLRVEANNSKNSRSDFFEISSGSKKYRVSITQSGNRSDSYNSNSTRVNGSIINVWTDHNVTDSYGNNGMRIHIKFDINGMLDRTGRAAVYFYYANGNPIKDTNDSYCTSNGDVATHVNFTPSYENSRFDDLNIFMPYSELHLHQTTSCYFTISIWNGNTEVMRSGINSFQVTF